MAAALQPSHLQEGDTSSASCTDDDDARSIGSAMATGLQPGANLFELIRANCQSAARQVVRQGLVNVNDVEPSTSWSYLHTAAYYGAERTVAALIKAGANVHAVTVGGETPLHMATKWPHEKTVEVLLKAGANPSAATKRGRTPVHNGALFARRGVLQLILAAGGDASVQDKDGNTALHLAARNHGPGPNEITRMLLRSRPRLDAVNKAGQAPLDLIPQHQSLVVFAAMEGLVDLMTALIARRGVKLDVFDVTGMTPLQAAAFKGDTAMARVLLAGGAKVNFQATPSWTACPSYGGAEGGMLTIGSSAASATATKPLGDRSPLHFAAERGAIPMMELLIAAGAKVNNTANEGLISPLHIAVWNQQAEAVRVLLAHKADVKARVNKNGMTALHFACNGRVAKLEIISALLDAKADIEERCSDGLTPLMLAAQMAPPDAVRLLLVRGARVQAKGRRCVTAVDCAEGRPDILLVLSQHCAARGLVDMAAKANAAAQRALRTGRALLAAPPPAQMPVGLPSLPPAVHGRDAVEIGSDSAATFWGPAATHAPAGSGSLSSGVTPSTGTWRGADSATWQGNDAASSSRLLARLSQQHSKQAAGSSRADTGKPKGRRPAKAIPSSSSLALVETAGWLDAALASLVNDPGAGDLAEVLGAHAGAMAADPLVPSSLTDMSTSPLLLGSGGTAGPDAMLPPAIGAGGGMSVSSQLSDTVQMLNALSGMVSGAGGGGSSGAPAPTLRRRSGTAPHASGGAVAATQRGRGGSPSGSTATSAASASGADASEAGGPGDVVGAVGVCVAGAAHCLEAGIAPRSGCAVAPGTALLQPTEHQLHMTCTSGCVLTFHLPCWKGVRERLRVVRSGGFPSSFNHVSEPVRCCAAACSGWIDRVAMVGPGGAQEMYCRPPGTPSVPAATANPTPGAVPAPMAAVPAQGPRTAADAVVHAAARLGPATSALLAAGGPMGPISPLSSFTSNNAVTQYTFRTNQLATNQPPPAPIAPSVLLPPQSSCDGGDGGSCSGGCTSSDAGSTPAGGAPASDGGATGVAVIHASDAGGTGGGASSAVDAHLVRRKRRAIRDGSTSGPGAGPPQGAQGPAPPPLNLSGEVLQGRNPPAPDLGGAAGLLGSKGAGGDTLALVRAALGIPDAGPTGKAQQHAQHGATPSPSPSPPPIPAAGAVGVDGPENGLSVHG